MYAVLFIIIILGKKKKKFSFRGSLIFFSKLSMIGRVILEVFAFGPWCSIKFQFGPPKENKLG